MEEHPKSKSTEPSPPVWLLSGSDDADGNKQDAQHGIAHGPFFAGGVGAAVDVHEPLCAAPGEAVGLPAAGHTPEHAVDAAHAALAEAAVVGRVGRLVGVGVHHEFARAGGG